MDPTILAMLLSQAHGENQFGGGVNFLSGLLGGSGKPYENAGREYEKYANRGKEYQNPFFEAGKRGLGNYEEWLNGQKDPSGFINHLMSGYSESPWASFQKQQGQRAADNSASASGLIGSTPYMQTSQDYARNISSQDQNQWLQHVLGVNTQYGHGEQNLMQGGQNSANILTQLQEMIASAKGQASYGESKGRMSDRNNLIGGGLQFLYG